MAGKAKNKLTLIGLCLMIFTSVYGFNNIPRAFYKMGYGAIPWYIIGGLFFFLPFALMVTELGSAFKEEQGGIYSWMEKAVSPTFAFVGTFMWYAAYIIWMVNVSSGIAVPIANFFLGSSDAPFLNNSTILSIVAIIWMIVVTFGVRRGLHLIQKITNIGGIASLSLNVLLLIGAIIIIIAKGHPATPITLHSLVSTPAPAALGTTGIVGTIAFMVYAIFAYGGTEAVGGLVDQTENPEKNFPRGILTSAIIIAVGYSVMILLVGFFMDYSSGGAFMNAVLAGLSGKGNLSLGTIGYWTIQQLGISLGQALGFSSAGAATMGAIFAHYVGLAMTLALTGAFFTLVYSPIKQIISGTPDKLWPGNYGQIDEKTGMPLHAMNWQLGIVLAIIVIDAILNIINAGAGAAFFNFLTNMTNVAMSLPYLLIIIAWAHFKLNDKIAKPFNIIKSKKFAMFLVVVTLIVVGFANLFTVIQPLTVAGAFAPDKLSTTLTSVISMVAGPVIFAVAAVVLMNKFKKSYPGEYQKLTELNKDEVNN